MFGPDSPLYIEINSLLLLLSAISETGFHAQLCFLLLLHSAKTLVSNIGEKTLVLDQINRFDQIKEFNQINQLDPLNQTLPSFGLHKLWLQ